MQKRRLDRFPSSMPVRVSAGTRSWKGTCINVSSDGALLRLEEPWTGESDLLFRFDGTSAPDEPVRAQVVRASSPDHVGAFLAIRFVTPAAVLTPSS